MRLYRVVVSRLRVTSGRAIRLRLKAKASCRRPGVAQIKKTRYILLSSYFFAFLLFCISLALFSRPVDLGGLRIRERTACLIPSLEQHYQLGSSTELPTWLVVICCFGLLLVALLAAPGCSWCSPGCSWLLLAALLAASSWTEVRDAPQ